MLIPRDSNKILRKSQKKLKYDPETAQEAIHNMEEMDKCTLQIARPSVKEFIGSLIRGRLRPS